MTSRATWLVVAIWVAFLPATAAAQRQSGITVTPDNKQIVVQKDVGSDRWSILYDSAAGTATGNVFPSSGGAPTFVWCQKLSDDGTSVMLSCSTAGPCVAGPCSQTWSSVGTVPIPSSFFQPPGGSGSGECPTHFAPTCNTISTTSFLAQGGHAFVEGVGEINLDARSGVALSSGPSRTGLFDFLDPGLSAPCTLSATFPQGTVSTTPNAIDFTGPASAFGVCIRQGSVSMVIGVLSGHVHMCEVCDVGGVVSGTFDLALQLDDATTTTTQGEFQMVRTPQSP